MNRALGFGVVTGGVISSLAAMPSPAAAHYSNISTERGGVAVPYFHGQITVWDNVCDNISIWGSYTLSDGRKGSTASAPNCNPDPVTTPVNGSIVAYRKCHISPGGTGCTEWKAT